MALKKPEVTSVFSSIYTESGEKVSEKKEKATTNLKSAEKSGKEVAEKEKAGKKNEEKRESSKENAERAKAEKQSVEKTALVKERKEKSVAEKAGEEKSTYNKEREDAPKTVKAKETPAKDEYWLSASVMLDPVHLDYIRKMSRHLKQNQQEFVYGIVDEEKRLHEKELKRGAKMTFQAARRKRSTGKKDRIQYNLRLPKSHLEFVDDYAELKGETRSSYFDGLIGEKMEEYLNS